MLREVCAQYADRGTSEPTSSPRALQVAHPAQQLNNPDICIPFFAAGAMAASAVLEGQRCLDFENMRRVLEGL